MIRNNSAPNLHSNRWRLTMNSFYDKRKNWNFEQNEMKIHYYHSRIQRIKLKSDFKVLIYKAPPTPILVLKALSSHQAL